MPDDFGVSFREISALVKNKIQILDTQKKTWAAYPTAVEELDKAIVKLERIRKTLKDECCSQESCPDDKYRPRR